jgi:soluble lytic murein transglycosylase
MRRFIALLILLCLPAFAHAGNEAVKNRAYFTEGIAYYNKGNYAEAIKNLGTAYKKLPSVGDYSLLYMAKSYIETGSPDKAKKNVRTLYQKYPDSPLVEKARGIEIMAALQRDEPGVLGLMEQYVRDYPSDMDMKFLFAEFLNETGRTEDAKPLLKDIYRSACPLSAEALDGLEPEDITALDLLERGFNLIQSRQYGFAEKDLRAALDKCDDTLRPNVTAMLADTLFRLRKYGEASELFLEVDDLYNAARSFIRDGNEKKFHKAMKKLVASKDPKGAKLMISYAADLRRKGKTNDALKMLKKVIKKYPEAAEEALWSKGWIYYRNRDYTKAKKSFSELYSQYKAPKYLYWQARASEREGEDPTELYKKIDDDGFYGVLTRLRTGRLTEQAENPRETEAREPEPIERIDLLVDAGLNKEAAQELILMAKRKSTYRSLREIALRLMSLQQYRKAMLIASTLPQDMQPFEVQYPMAFWSSITSEATGNGIDPYIVLSLMREESRFDPEALSSAGAVGLMQLMPETAELTARRLNIPVDGPESLRNVDLNIKLGSHFLSGLLNRFDSVPAALAAYNAGGTRVKTWLSQNNYRSSDEFIEDIPFEETRNYVKRIVRTYFHYWRARPAEEKVSWNIL